MDFDILNFLYYNWQNILITLIGGAIFYVLSNYAIKKYIVSAEKERIKQAKNELLNILESRVINKRWRRKSPELPKIRHILSW